MINLEVASGVWATRVVGGSLSLFLLLACGGTAAEDTSPGAGSSEGGESQATGEGLTYTYESLDLSTLGAQSANWCELPPFAAAEFVALDKASFRELLADYALSWLTPVHEGIHGIDEPSLFNATFETVMATYLTGCNWNRPDELNFEDDELLDPELRADVRRDITEFLDAAQVVSEGTTLRLSVHDCPTCAEPLGSEPFFITAQLTQDGVLVVKIELQAGDPSVHTLILTPDAAVARTDLASFTNWMKGITAATRSGESAMPDATGIVTAIARKNHVGGISATLGISGLSLDSEADSADNVRVMGPSSCMGMHFGVDDPNEAVQMALSLGDFQATVPGHLNCDTSSCGDKELEDWVYSLNGFSMTASQPDKASDKELEVDVNTERASSASVGGDVFAEGGFGKAGKGGELSAEVDVREDGFMVTFKPALNVGGAMKLSAFSDKFRLDLPTWLADEIFDVTFGGGKSSKVFVPVRAQCNNEQTNPDGTDPPEPLRRQVEIIEGEVVAVVGSGTKKAAAGTCAGQTLQPESELVLTSDWVDLGFTCE